MPTNLRHIEEALAGLTDTELRALKVAANETPQVEGGLSAWINGACDWEIDRRCGRHHEFLPPEATIDATENETITDATYALRQAFAGGDLEAGMRTFFDALSELLAGGPQRNRNRGTFG